MEEQKGQSVGGPVAVAPPHKYLPPDTHHSASSTPLPEGGLGQLRSQVMGFPKSRPSQASLTVSSALLSLISSPSAAHTWRVGSAWAIPQTADRSVVAMAHSWDKMAECDHTCKCHTFLCAPPDVAREAKLLVLTAHPPHRCCLPLYSFLVQLQSRHVHSLSQYNS